MSRAILIYFIHVKALRNLLSLLNKWNYVVELILYFGDLQLSVYKMFPNKTEKSRTRLRPISPHPTRLLPDYRNENRSILPGRSTILSLGLLSLPSMHWG